MIAKESKLRLLSSDIIHSEISFMKDTSSKEGETKETAEEPVDIDFDVKISNTTEEILVFTQVEVNPKEKSNFGYHIYVEGVSAFRFAKDTQKKEKENLIGSAVNISITNLRSYIKNVTSYYPMGSYVFHSIDMKSLFEAKNLSMKEEERERERERERKKKEKKNEVPE